MIKHCAYRAIDSYAPECATDADMIADIWRSYAVDGKHICFSFDFHFDPLSVAPGPITWNAYKLELAMPLVLNHSVSHLSQCFLSQVILPVHAPDVRRSKILSYLLLAQKLAALRETSSVIDGIA